MLLNAADTNHIQQAAQALARGELVGLPTETVYGLAARADDDQAVAQIFTAKKRPTKHPLIVHVADMAAAEHFVAAGFLQQLPDYAASFMRAFWPGALTIIVPRRQHIANAAAGQHPTIALRCPNHPTALAVLQAAHKLGVAGVAAPSANQFGGVSPTTALHVQEEFGEDLCILDGGVCSIGVESTIIDCTGATPKLLRPGAITPDMIAQHTNIKVQIHTDNTAAHTPASGTLTAHYAPQAKLRIMGAKEMQDALDLLGRDAPPMGIWSRTVLTSRANQVRLAAMPHNAAEAAQELFARLRAFDAQGVKLIWVEPVPTSQEWAAVADRLQRAAAS